MNKGIVDNKSDLIALKLKSNTLFLAIKKNYYINTMFVRKLNTNDFYNYFIYLPYSTFRINLKM